MASGMQNGNLSSVILVGTYRRAQMQKWILPKGLYNYPISDADEIPLDTRAAIKELWLCCGMAKPQVFDAEYLGVLDRSQLDNYPEGQEKPHANSYLIFKATPKIGSTLDEAPVIVRAADFSRRSPSIRRQILEALSSGDFGNRAVLSKYFPPLVSSLPPGRLWVCETGEQLTFSTMSSCDVDSFAKTDGFGPIHDASARKKRSLGQFFTEGDNWLHPQVANFIRRCGAKAVYDPFAGSGCLLRTVERLVGGFDAYIGLDIDPSLAWERNDSLLSIPPRPDAVVVTNPPYLSNYSAARKGLAEATRAYFASTDYDDLYLLALDRLLDAQHNVVAIVPETFVNSPYRRKNRLSSVTILQASPFLDTDTPVVVLCFDGQVKPFDDIRVYKDATYVSTLRDIENCRLKPDNSVSMQFNDPKGWLGVRCVDTTDPTDTLHFDFKENIDYDWASGIKVSSRLLTLLSIDVPATVRQPFLTSCNRILATLRTTSADLVLSPFKGNMKNGVRRRRLDFSTCRAIVERAYAETVPSHLRPVQSVLF